MKANKNHKQFSMLCARAWVCFVVILFVFLTQTISRAAVTDALGQLGSYQGSPMIKGFFSYRGSGFAVDTRGQFFYSDGYFKESATVYDEHLATMSLCLAGSAMASYEGQTINYPAKSDNVRELLDRIGCTDICVNTDFVTKPGEDTIGVALGRKTITLDGQEYTLIPIGIRGAGYEREWVGNMKVGSDGDAEGFSKAADRARQTVDAYLKQYAIAPARTKFWIAGFSRAGAVTDLLTKSLTDDYDPTGARVYGYSFATPQGAYQRGRSYPNSHCTVNREDAVPTVVPSYMGFSHYGDEVYLEDRGNPFRSYTMSIDYAVDIGPLSVPGKIVLNESQRFTSQSAFIGELMETLQRAVASDRATFTGQRIEGEATVEELLSYLLKFLMTSDSDHVTAVMDSVMGFQDRLGFRGLLKLSEMIDAVEEGIATKSQEERDVIYATLWTWFGDSLKETLTTEEYERVGSMWKSFIYVLFEFAHDDYMHSGREGFALIGTMMKNMSLIGQAHTPEKYFSLVKKKDSFYYGLSGKTVDKKDGTFRIGEAQDVDAVIYEKDKPIAAIREGRLTAADDPAVCIVRTQDKGSDLQAAATDPLYTNPNPDTERAVVLMPDTDYRVELIAGDRGADVEFQKWIDESGREVSTDPVYTVLVNHGQTTHRMLKPVYRTIPKETPEPGSPEKPGSTENGGSGAWIWALLGVLAAGGGVGGGIYLKKRRNNR